MFEDLEPLQEYGVEEEMKLYAVRFSQWFVQLNKTRNHLFGCAQNEKSSENIPQHH